MKAYPKVNLALDILGKATCGHHFIETILYEVKGKMFDEILVEKIPKGVEIICDDPSVPVDKKNTVWRAAALMQKEWRKCRNREKGQTKALNAHFRSSQSRQKGVSIIIKKRIPPQSGLGGGSSDAGAVMRALNKLWHLQLPAEKLEKLAAKIGNDVPFFIRGGLALGTHFGEKIAHLPHKLPLKIQIIKTGIRTDTAWAYKNIDIGQCGRNRDKTRAMLAAIKAGDAAAIIKNIHNDFGALHALRKPLKGHLTGSGGAVFKILSCRKWLARA